MNGRQDLEHDSQGNGKFLGDRCQAVAPKLPLPSFRRDGKLAMIRLFVLVRGLRNAGGSFSSVARSVFSVAKISCREEASLLAFFIGFEAAVESRSSSKHGCTCGNCEHFQPSWNLVVEFYHWLQIAHLSWKCLVRVCRRLGNVIRMFLRRETYMLYTTRWTFRFRNSGFIDDYLSDWCVRVITFLL